MWLEEIYRYAPVMAIDYPFSFPFDEECAAGFCLINDADAERLHAESNYPLPMWSRSTDLSSARP